jgi:hypothetical protein
MAISIQRAAGIDLMGQIVSTDPGLFACAFALSNFALRYLTYLHERQPLRTLPPEILWLRV